jgi:hypothetical protein
MLTSTLTLSTGTIGLGGLDVGALSANTLYYVYAAVSNNVLGLVMSLSSLAPSGFLQYVNIGRVRTFFGSAGLAVAAVWVNGRPAEPSSAPLGDIGITVSGFTTNNAKYDCTRVANQLQVDFFFLIASIIATPAAINIPLYAMDLVNKLSNLGNGQIVGSHVSADFSATVYTVGAGNRGGMAFTDGATTNKVFLGVNTASSSLSKFNGSAGWNANSSMTGQFMVPIVEWAGLYS